MTDDTREAEIAALTAAMEAAYATCMLEYAGERKRESELERELRLAREENTALRRALLASARETT